MEINVWGKVLQTIHIHGFIQEQANDNKEYSYNYIHTYEHFQHEDHKC